MQEFLALIVLLMLYIFKENNKGLGVEAFISKILVLYLIKDYLF